MSSFASPRPFPTLFTEKHAGHDKIWIVQNSSSEMLCFACLMEILEDPKELSFKKRKVASEVLDVFTTNRLIWNIFSRNAPVLVHTGNVLLRLLFTSDEDLLCLLVETLGVLMLKSKDENVGSILESLVDILTENKTAKKPIPEVYITLLGKLIRGSKFALHTILDQHLWLLEKIAHSINKIEEEEAVAYWYIFSQVYRNADSSKVGIGISKIILQSISDAIAKSANKNLQLNILAVLKYFSTSIPLKQLLLDYERCEFACNGTSFAEIFKKLLLSQCNDIRTAAIQSITELISVKNSEQNVLKLAENFIDKGLCEFLFELLNSPHAQIVESALFCLIQFTNVKKFFTTGHLIFGLQPIVSALSRMVEEKNKPSLHNALTLILGIFQKSDQTIFNQEKQLIEILASLTKLCRGSDTKIILLVVSCAKEITDRLVQLDDNVLELIDGLLEDVCRHLLTDAQNNAGGISGTKKEINILSATLALVFNGFKLLKSLESNLAGRVLKQQGNPKQLTTELQKDVDEKKPMNPTNIVYYVMDVYCIPATMLLLPTIRDSLVFSLFFDLLTNLMKHSPSLEFARKLAESSFIWIASDVKARFIKDDVSNACNTSINDFLQTLVSVFEDAESSVNLASILSETLNQLNIPPNDWHLYFTRRFAATTEIDQHAIQCCQIACLALAYSSTKYGHPLWTTDTIMKTLSAYLLDASNFKQLPEISKRHLIYLWSHARQFQIDAPDKVSTQIPENDNTSRQESIPSKKARLENTERNIPRQENVLIDFLTDSNSIENFFFPEKSYITWVLNSRLNYDLKKATLLKLFDCEEDDKRIVRILEMFKDNSDFYVISVDIIANTAEHCSSKVLLVTLMLLQSSCNGKSFSIIAKDFIHKTILSRAADLHHTNLSALYQLYRALPLSEDGQLSDIDLKFALRACNVFVEHPYLDVRIAILNCLNYLLRNICPSNDCSAQLALFSSASFLNEVSSIIPDTLRFIDSQVEKLAAASLVFITQISRAFLDCNADTHALPSLSPKKGVMISGLAYSGSRLIQLACIQFCKAFLLIGNEQSAMRTEREALTLTLEEAKTILVYLQNLVISEEVILRGTALQCLAVFIQLLKKRSAKVQNPWNIFLLDQAIDDVASFRNTEHNLRLALILLDCGTTVNYDVVIEKIGLIVKNFRKENREKTVENLMQGLVFSLLETLDLDQGTKEDWNSFLCELGDNSSIPVKECKAKDRGVMFVNASGVVFPLDGEKLPEVDLSNIQKYRDRLFSA